MLLLFNGVAQQFVHHFYDHQDTIHTQSDNCHQLVKVQDTADRDISSLDFEHDFKIETQHHHCEFLNYVGHTFLKPTHPHIVKFNVFKHASKYLVRNARVIPEQSIQHVLSRGPPSIA